MDADEDAEELEDGEGDSDDDLKALRSPASDTKRSCTSRASMCERSKTMTVYSSAFISLFVSDPPDSALPLRPSGSSRPSSRADWAVQATK